MTLSCPSCGAALTGGPRCASCDLSLVGPEAARLWEVDQALLALDASRDRLLTERGSLLAVLRGEPVPEVAGSLAPTPPTRALAAQPPTAFAPPAALPPAAFAPPAALPPAAPAAPAAPEWTPARVQNTLLGAGAVLLAVAATVFAAVTYDRLGASGRAGVLALLTVLALSAVPVLLRRGLAASAETATGVALVLGALDAYGLRTLGLGDALEPETYAALSAAALATASAGWAALHPLRLPRVAAVALAQLPVPLLLVAGEAGPGAAGLALTALGTADLALLLATRRRSLPDVTAAAATCAAASLALALPLALVGAYDAAGLGVVALLALAGLAAAVAVVGSAEGGARLVLTAVPVPLVAVAAHALARPELTGAQEPLVAAAVGLLAAQAAALLPSAWRSGPLTGALAVTAAGVASQARPVLEALAGPLAWPVDAWSLPATSIATDARSALLPGGATWSGTVVTLVVLLAAATALLTAGALADRLRAAAGPVGVLVVASVVLLPLGLATGYRTALVVLLVGSALLLGAGRAWPAAPAGPALSAAGAATLLLAVTWSCAAEDATLVVLPVAAAGLALLSATGGPGALRDPAAGAAAVLAGAVVASHGAARGLSAEQVGGLLLGAPAFLLLLSTRTRRLPLEAAALLLAPVAVVLAAADPGWLSWVLAGLGLTALGLALRPDRRAAAVAGAVLLSASSWVRLADAGVEAPEPYAVPPALLALLLGHLRRRAEPTTPSMAAYAPGLGLLLLPSLLASFDDASPARGVAVLAISAGVLVSGVSARLRAPLLLGGGVLVVDALALLAPYAAALPRWLPLALLGLALLSLGTTYEQRRRDLGALRERLDSYA